MDCREIPDHLDGYLDGVASLELLAHVQECRCCRLLLLHCRQTVEVYRGQPSPPLPAAVHERLMEKVGQGVPPRRPRPHPTS